MSSASERAAELRALADQYEAVGGIEEQQADAVTAYRANPSEETKAAYTQASEALRAARQDSRSGSVMVAPNEPGSVTIGAQTVKKAG